MQRRANKMLQQIYELRNKLDLLKVARNNAENEVFATEQHKRIQKISDDVAETVKLLAATEDDYRQTMIEGYNEGKEKKRPGGKIKICAVFSCDEFVAHDFAVQNKLASLLKLDKSRFENAVKNDF